MTGLFSLTMGVDKAAAVTLLYRIATFILPFVIGAGMILRNRVRRYILERWERLGCADPDASGPDRK